MSDKAADKSTLLMQFGRLTAGLADLAERATPPSSAEYRISAAQFSSDLPTWLEAWSRFATIGTVRFENEDRNLRVATERFKKLLRHVTEDNRDAGTVQAGFRDGLAAYQKTISDGIDHIPIKWEPQLLSAKTPLSTCLLIGDAISGAKQRLDYFDRYLDPEFFSLYLRRLSRSVSVRLVTTAGNNQYGVASVQALANLAVQEFASFKLIQCAHTDLHDRNLRVDENVFHLGPSANKAGAYPTNFNPGDSTPSGHQILDQIIAAGTVVV